VYHWLVMADSKPAAYGATVAAPFATVVEHVRPHTKLAPLVAFVLTRLLPAPREAAA
jgi:hypothetical protein